MTRNWIGALVVMVTTCATGRADVIFEYEPLVLIKDEPTEVTLALSGSRDFGFGLGAMHWTFSSDAELSIGDFAWEATTFADPDFVLSVNPPEMGWTGSPEESPARVTAKGSIIIGTLEVTGTKLGALEMSLANLEVFPDDSFEPLEVKNGSEVGQFQVVPEPSSILLVGVGAMWVLRRRRMRL